MTLTAVDGRKEHFAENWLAWCSLHHFLPAPLLSELLSIAVLAESDGKIEIGELFDQNVVGDGPLTASWIIRQLETTDQTASYLQRQVQAIAWQGDNFVYTPDVVDKDSGKKLSTALEKSVHLGLVDLRWEEGGIDRLSSDSQESYGCLVGLIKKVRSVYLDRDVVGIPSDIRDETSSLPAPLNAVVAKHLGDLFADVDQWDRALKLYELSRERLSGVAPEVWDDYVCGLKSVLDQSIAAAQWHLEDVQVAGENLGQTVSESGFSSAPIAYLNAGMDALVSQSKSLSFGADRRATVVFPPLVLQSHNTSAGVESWLNGETRYAVQRLWATLRRQVALGSNFSRNESKFVLGRCLVAEIEQNLRKEHRPDDFRTAVEFLIESGNAKGISQIKWEEPLVSTYVNVELIESAVDCCGRYPRVKNERTHALLNLFQSWVAASQTGWENVLGRMCRIAVNIARENKANVDSTENVSGRAIEYLIAAAKQRPDIRVQFQGDVADTIVLKLRSQEWWTVWTNGLELAVLYASVFSQDSLDKVVIAALELLNAIKDKPIVAHIARSALQLLTDDAVRSRCRHNADLGERVVQEILTLGKLEGGSGASVLFYLNRWDPALIRAKSVADELAKIVLKAQQDAVNVNSSVAIEAIHVLISVPSAAGAQGIGAALSGLERTIVEGMKSGHSINLPYAYSPLITLAKEKAALGAEYGSNNGEFNARLNEIAGAVRGLWEKVRGNPLLFAGFSFPPPSRPDSVLVHNWVVASLEFAEALGRKSEILIAIENAGSNPLLAEGIGRGRVTQGIVSKSTSIDVEEVKKDGAPAFYETLGFRLTAMQAMEQKERVGLCNVLVDKCLRYGPKGLDLAVFLEAGSLGVDKVLKVGHVVDYLRRLESQRELSLSLMPALSRLVSQDSLN